MRASAWRFVIAMVACALVGGCGGDGVKPMANLVPVEGTVSFEGKPLEGGTVSFAPEGPGGQPAVGQIRNGEFTMATTPSAQGVVAGKYKVMIVSTGASGTPPPPPLKAGDAPAAAPKSLIPEKYNDVKTSGLEVEVANGMAPLQWDLKP